MSDIKVREINKKIRNQTTDRKVENRTTVSEHTGYVQRYTGLNAPPYEGGKTSAPQSEQFEEADIHIGQFIPKRQIGQSTPIQS
jgi:hypothetical protein